MGNQILSHMKVVQLVEFLFCKIQTYAADNIFPLKISLRSKRSCSTEELRNDFPQIGCAKVGATTSAQPVCGKSFRSSSVEQERLLRRLLEI